MAARELHAYPGGRLRWSAAAILLLLVGQLCWWVAFQWRAAQAQYSQGVANLQLQLAAAGEGSCRGAVDSCPAESALQLRYPALRLLKGPEAALPPPAQEMAYPLAGEGRLVVAQSYLQALAAKRSAQRRMFVAEGCVFLALVLLAGQLMWRMLKQEMALVRQQHNFLSAVTHELKSPLAALRLAVQTLELRQLSPERQQHYLRTMHADLKRLNQLIDNLLRVAQLGAAQQRSAPQILDLSAAFARWQAEGQRRAQASGLQLAWQVPAEPVYARVDEGALEVIVSNLLDNACKYTRPPGSVRMQVTAFANAVQIDCIDGGVGIAKEELVRIFEPFYRVGDELVRQSQGSGIGLYLVRNIAQQQGGEVSVYSAGLGQGATFTVTFPRCAQEP